MRQIQPALSTEQTASLAAQLARVYSPGAAFSWTIDSADEMFRYSVESVRGSVPCGALLYFLKGWQIFSAFEQVARWKFGDPARIAAVLDFASGWGRSTRFLREIVPSSRITVTDAVEDAMAVQSAMFGVRSEVTTASPASFSPSCRFDLVLAASFFSHLPESTFPAWLRRLADALTPEGVLMFSTHGLELLGGSHPAGERGFEFLAASESSHLNPEEYGTCYVDAAYVEATVRRELGAEYSLGSWRRGLAGHQDLYLLWRGNASVPAISRYPWGDVDRFDRGSTIELAGWCSDLTENGRGDLVELTVDAEVRASCTPTEIALATPGLNAGPECWTGRWALSVPRAGIGLDDVLALWARNSAGRQNLIGLGTLRQFAGD